MLILTTNIYVPHGMSNVIKITNVIKKLTYNYVPHDMFDVTKLIKMIRTLAY
jgi:hypothetical protein